MQPKEERTLHWCYTNAALTPVFTYVFERWTLFAAFSIFDRITRFREDNHGIVTAIRSKIRYRSSNIDLTTHLNEPAATREKRCWSLILAHLSRIDFFPACL